MIIRQPTTLHIAKIVLINDIIGTILLRGMILRGMTLPHLVAATTPLIAKDALEITTVKELLAIDIRIVILKEHAGDLYIHEEHT